MGEAEGETLETIASRLEEIAKEHPGQGWTEERWVGSSNPSGYHSVGAREVEDLAKLFRAASDQKLKLVAWY